MSAGTTRHSRHQLNEMDRVLARTRDRMNLDLMAR